jgi:hypothetical protein
MTRASIFIALALLAALVIGAASYQHKSATPLSPKKIWFDQKCTDSPSGKNAGHQCLRTLGTKNDQYADLFLRSGKRKVRILYA